MSQPSRWLLALLLLSPALPAIELDDDLGHPLRLEAPAQRIISLAPHITELLFAAGAGERIVGATSYSDYPPQAAAIPRVGDATAPDYERILQLQPDLVIAWHSGNGTRVVQRLRDLGLTVYASEPRRLEAIPATIERFGQLAGSQSSADPVAAALREALQQLRERYSKKEHVSVFYQLWHQPLMTIGGSHIINQVIELCAGENIFATQPELALTVSVEAVLSADPQVILTSGSGEVGPQWYANWLRWDGLRAVADGRLHAIDPDLLQRPTPRLLQGTQQVCEALQPQRERQ